MLPPPGSVRARLKLVILTRRGPVSSACTILPRKSDTADEVHFHGYDVHKEVAKGGSVQFKFPATIDGEFVVELENHKQTLANVTVEP